MPVHSTGSTIHHLRPASREFNLRLPIFCIPHAGGVAAAFEPWMRPGRDRGIEFVPLELPGHGRRRHERLVRTMEQVVEGVLDQVEYRSPEQAFAILGHSMGALVGYEVCRRLQSLGRRLPQLLIVSGARAPGVMDDQNWPAVSDEQLLLRMVALGGLPAEVTRNRYAKQLLTSALRCDLELTQAYRNRAEPEVLDCPILALAGETDALAGPGWTAAWKSFTRSDFDQIDLPGGHFFVYQNSAAVLDRLHHQVLDGASYDHG